MKPRPNTARNVATGALAASAVLAATMLSIPVPGYRLYFNFGEAVIYTIALLLGRKHGAIAGAIGASLADVLLGYPLWAPFTFLIKGSEGFIAGLLRKRGIFPATGCAALVMIAGYTTLAGILYGVPAAPVECVTDLIQTGIGIFTARVLVPVIRNRIPRFASGE